MTICDSASIQDFEYTSEKLQEEERRKSSLISGSSIPAVAVTAVSFNHLQELIPKDDSNDEQIMEGDTNTNGKKIGLSGKNGFLDLDCCIAGEGLRKRSSNGYNLPHPNSDVPKSEASEEREGRSKGLIQLSKAKFQPKTKKPNGAVNKDLHDPEFPEPIRKKRCLQETFEECSMLDAFYTYLCYSVLLIVGLFNDLFRPTASTEKYREGYVPLYASFESFYTRHVYRRVKDCWGIPVCSVPGKYITLNPRITDDYNRTSRKSDKFYECINLGSYNYLGFAENDGACSRDAIESIWKNGISLPSTRREIGNSKLHDELDALVAQFLGVEDAITCAMGFATNALNIPSIISKGSLVISDEKNHASIILGLRLSGATIRVFEHNNMKSLEKKIRQALINGQPKTHLPWEKIFIVIEGVYSMEGSIVRLPQIIDLKKKYGRGKGIYIYLDEAHSIGAVGDRGRGVIDYWDCDPKDVDICMGTFTKSFGSAGGYIGGSKELIDYLRFTSQAHCYGTSMSPPVITQIMTSMKIIMGMDGTNDGVNRISQLARNSKYLRQKLKQKGFIVYGNDDSPVVPVALYMPSKITYIIRQMMVRGVATVGVGFPATKVCEGRTRFCVSASHTKEMLDKAISVFVEVGSKICVQGSKLPPPEGEILYEQLDHEHKEDID